MWSRAVAVEDFSNGLSSAPLRQVMENIGRAIAPAMSALSLLAVFMLTFAALGMQLFGGGYDAAVLSRSIPAVPRLNFNSLWWSLITVYEVSVSDISTSDRI